MNRMKKTQFGNKLLLMFLSLCLGLFVVSPTKVHAEGELRLSASQESVLLEAGGAVTLNINYSSDVAVKNVNAVLNTQNANQFSVQNVLSSSGASVNGAGSLGSVTLIAPATYAKGEIVLSASAENRDDPSVKYSATISIPVAVNLPAPAEAGASSSSAEGSNAEAAPTEAAAAATGAVALSVKLNGVGDLVSVNVSENAPEGLPEGFSEVVANVQGQNIRTYKKAGRMPLVYISLLAGGAETLYSLDAEKGFAYRFFPDVYTEIGGQSVIVTSLTEPAPDSNLISQDIDLNGFSTTAWIGEIKGKEYTVIRAEMGGKVSDLYQYITATDGKTSLLPFKYDEIINPVTPTPVPTTTPTTAVDPVAAALKESANASKIDWFFWGLLGVFLLLIAGLVFLYLRNRAKYAAAKQPNRRVARSNSNQAASARLNASRSSRASAQRSNHSASPRYELHPSAKSARPLRELTPNNFDDVDRYFSQRPEKATFTTTDPAARSGVRRPRLSSSTPEQPTARPASGQRKSVREGSGARRYDQASSWRNNMEERNPYRSYYKSENDNLHDETHFDS